MLTVSVSFLFLYEEKSRSVWFLMGTKKVVSVSTFDDEVLQGSMDLAKGLDKSEIRSAARRSCFGSGFCLEDLNGE
jgi:hypothetical protein